MQTLQQSLQVDDREPQKIFNILDSKGIPYTKTRLLVGDFVYKDWVFERKCLNDMFCSTINGRLYSQIENMQQNYSNIVVLVSGTMKDLFMTNKSPGLIFSVIASLTVRYRIPVIRCGSDSELIEQLSKFMEKIESGKAPDFIHRIKMSSTDIYSSMIACVPGIGIQKAVIIAEKFTHRELLDCTIDDLKEIKGVGLKMADNVKKYFN